MVDPAEDDIAEIAEEDPEAALLLLGALLNEKGDAWGRSEVMMLFDSLAEEGVNLARLMREYPETAREAFGSDLPMPSESMVDRYDRDDET